MSRFQTLHGACHCGKLGLRFETAIDCRSFNPRACDCSFCRKHGAAYISDANGRLIIDVGDPSALHAYRQGSENAQFILCRHCGVLLAVVYEAEDTTYGAVNSGCLEERQSLGAAQVASPQLLSPEEKVLRWSSLWTPDVVFRVSEA